MFKKARQNDPAAGSSKVRGQYKQLDYTTRTTELDAALASSTQLQQQHQHPSYASRSTITAPPTVLKDAVSHSHPSPAPRDVAPASGPTMSSPLQDQQAKNLLQSLSAFTAAPNPSLSSAYLHSANSKRASIQSTASRSSAITAATSRSSLDRLSNDYHGTGETSTLASSQAPPSTESLGLAKSSSFTESKPQDVPISEIQPSWQRRASQEAMHDRAASSSKATVSAHQRSVSSAAAPATAVLNSDYESSSRTRFLRRMKGQSLGSTRGATSTSDASLPASKEGQPVPSSAATLARSPLSKQNDREMVRPSFLSSHSRKPSDDSQSTHSGHLPEVQSPSMAAKPSIAQSLSAVSSPQRAPTNSNQRSATSSSTAYLHPQLAKLKETSIPQLASPVLSSASSSRWSGLQSPQTSSLMSATSDRTSLWLPPTSSVLRPAHASSSSATLYSIPHDSSASTTLMTSSTSSRPSRVDSTLDPSKVYSPAPPSPTSTYVTALTETIVGSQTPGHSTASTAMGRPQSPVSRPGSAQVQAIFSPASIASRLPTPHPLRGSGLPKQSSHTILSGITPISTPPPLPPSSTRPDVVGSPTKPVPMAKQASLREVMMERLKATTSPSPGSVISSSFTAMPGSSKRASAPPGPTQPQSSVLRSYGLEKSSQMVPQPPAPQRRISHEYPQSEYGDSEAEEHEEYDVVHSTQVVQVTTKTVRRGSRTVTSPVPVADYTLIPSPAISTHDARKSVYSPPPQTTQTPTNAASSKGHGILDMFRSKSPHQRSTTVPPNLQSSNGSFHNLRGASPSPRPRTPGNGTSKMSLPFRLFGHRPTKSTVSDLSGKAVVDTDHDGGMSSCSSLVQTASEVGAVGPPSPPMRDPIEAVLDWQGRQVEGFKQTGRTKQRTPGVTWELPPGHGEPSGEEDDQRKRKIPLMRRSRRVQMTTTADDDL